MTPAVHCQQAARLVEFNVVADGREKIQNFAVVWLCITNTIRGDHRQMQRTRNADRSLVSPLLFAFLMALQLDIDIFLPENMRQPLDRSASFVLPSATQCCCKRTFIPS